MLKERKKRNKHPQITRTVTNKPGPKKHTASNTGVRGNITPNKKKRTHRAQNNKETKKTLGISNLKTTKTTKQKKTTDLKQLTEQNKENIIDNEPRKNN